jgi:hypothetical protein
MKKETSSFLQVRGNLTFPLLEFTYVTEQFEFSIKHSIIPMEFNLGSSIILIAVGSMLTSHETMSKGIPKS